MLDPIKGMLPASPAVDGAAALSGPREARAQGVDGVGTDFSALISEALAGVSDQLRRSEAVSIAGIKGTASTQAVVEEVMAAEQSLQAAIAVRDKIVAAYLEISRMAI